MTRAWPALLLSMSCGGTPAPREEAAAPPGPDRLGLEPGCLSAPERAAAQAGADSGCGVMACGAVPSPCASEPDPAPGAVCETAIVLGASAETTPLAGSATPATLRCAAESGPSAHFLLDLSQATEPVPVQVLIDAAFPFEAALARGPCGDLRLARCGTPLYADRRSRLIATTLAPDRYVLVVSAVAAEAVGEVHVSASTGELSCSAPPSNDDCRAAEPIDTTLRVQSRSATLACAEPELAVRCSAIAAPDVFYALDLSDRPSETLLDVDVTAAAGRFVTATLFGPSSEGCGEVWMCGPQFSGRLAPGLYHLGVSEAEPVDGPGYPGLPAVAGTAPSPFALRIGLSDTDCTGTPNDTWQTALDIDPNAERQRLTGNTACGTNQFDSACFADRGAPDLFYRLDLRGAGPKELEVDSLLDTGTVNYLLLADPAGGAPQLVRCDEFSSHFFAYDLGPRLYYLVVDGRVRNAARFELELRLSPAEPRSCVSDALERCMANSEPACADSQADPRCLATAVECGLEARVFEGFCAASPECCAGTGDASACLEAWREGAECR